MIGHETTVTTTFKRRQRSEPRDDVMRRSANGHERVTYTQMPQWSRGGVSVAINIDQ